MLWVCAAVVLQRCGAVRLRSFEAVEPCACGAVGVCRWEFMLESQNDASAFLCFSGVPTCYAPFMTPLSLGQRTPTAFGSCPKSRIACFALCVGLALVVCVSPNPPAPSWLFTSEARPLTSRRALVPGPAGARVKPLPAQVMRRMPPSGPDAPASLRPFAQTPNVSPNPRWLSGLYGALPFLLVPVAGILALLWSARAGQSPSARAVGVTGGPEGEVRIGAPPDGNAAVSGEGGPAPGFCRWSPASVGFAHTSRAPKVIGVAACAPPCASRPHRPWGSVGRSAPPSRAGACALAASLSDGEGEALSTDLLPPLPNGDALAIHAPGWRRGYGTGGRVWPASRVLCRWLAAEADLVRGAAVLELGCGCGGVGIYAAACGARRVVLTDGTAALCDVARDNARANRDLCPDADVQARRYPWGEPLTELRGLGSGAGEDGVGGFDLVLGSDVTYGTDPAALCASLKMLLTPGAGAAPPRVILTHQLRPLVAALNNGGNLDRFVAIAEGLGLRATTLSTERDGLFDFVYLLEVTRA